MPWTVALLSEGASSRPFHLLIVRSVLRCCMALCGGWMDHAPSDMIPGAMTAHVGHTPQHLNVRTSCTSCTR